jgi:hypothetical protein
LPCEVTVPTHPKWNPGIKFEFTEVCPKISSPASIHILNNHAKEERANDRTNAEVEGSREHHHLPQMRREEKNVNIIIFHK